MSNLLEKASLVMIPSGYKEDVVYSEIPLDGSGDMAFTRSSNGTRVNSAGLVEVVPWNLAQQSETFGVSPWTTSTLSITTNATTAPNGTTTAAKLMVSTANTPHQVQQSFNNENANHTVFIYAKKSELNFVQLALGNSTEQYANFNLNTGVVGTKGTYCASSSIESVGNGWYKCSAYFNQGTIPSLMVYVTNSASSDWGGVVSYSGANNTDGIFVWGYQLNIGSTAKPYFPTTDRLNVPRLTYQNGGGGCPSLLLEKQSTNVETWSEDFSNASWTKTNCSITANATTSPDGTQNADKIIENSVNGVHFVYNVGATISVAQTLSVYAKADTRTQLALQLGALSVIYNLSSGTIVSGSGGAIENAGNGWYRCSITTTPANTNALIFTANGGTNSYQGDGTSGLFIWGAQLEESSYPTSYIPTTSSSATRVLDECSKTGISSLIGQTEGVLFVDFVFTAYDYDPKWVAFLGGGASYIGIYTQSTPEFVCEIANSGVPQFFSNTYVFSVGQRYKLAIAYKANDFAFYVNGTQVATDSSGTVPATSQFALQYNTATANLTSRIYNEVILFPTRLTNAELASLTTI